MIVTPWTWLIAAAVLAGLEIVSPGAFMIWLAAAAVGTALLGFAIDPGWQWQVVHFVLLSIIAVLLGRHWLGRRAAPMVETGLNRRLETLVGTTVTVVEPIIDGRGRVQLGDSPWSATGPDLAAGARAQIIRVEGTALVVIAT